MRTKPAVLLAVLCLAAALPALASDLTVSPSQVSLFDLEAFVTISGGTFNEGSIATFSGPGGTVTSEVSSFNASTGAITVAVPTEVAITAGRYTVTVHTVSGEFVFDDGPGFVDVVDTTPPQPPLLSLPETVNAEATSLSGAIVTFDVSAFSFQQQGPITPTCDHASGANYPIGGTLVKCSATDGFGTTQGEFVVSVTDTTAPVLTLPGDIDSNTSVVTFTASAVDNLDGPVSVVCTPPSGSTFNPGLTTVHCSAVDSHDNVASGTFTVRTPGGLPDLHLPGDLVFIATSASGAVVTYTATTDSHSTVACTPASGTLFAVGLTTVNCKATNTNGNTTGSFTVNVVPQPDHTPPQVTSITATPNNLWPPNHKMADVTVTVIAVDDFDEAPVSHIVSITSNQPDNGTGDGDVANDIVITGPLTAQLRAERAQNQVRTYTITVETSDATGNVTQSTVTVTVKQTSSSKK